MEEQNNKVFISGEIVTNAMFSHDVCGESFYEMSVACKRLSGVLDVLPVTISERLMNGYDFHIGSTINALGQFRSHNQLVDGKSKLMLTVFVTDLFEEPLITNPNKIVLQGYICKTPDYRTTPFNREITDVLIAVNRSDGRSDYIPCIVWGATARFAKNLMVGEKIAIVGRIQSREYQKRISDDIVISRIAYEVSTSKLYAKEKTERFNPDEEFSDSGVENGGFYEESKRL